MKIKNHCDFEKYDKLLPLLHFLCIAYLLATICLLSLFKFLELVTQELLLKLSSRNRVIIFLVSIFTETFVMCPCPIIFMVTVRFLQMFTVGFLPPTCSVHFTAKFFGYISDTIKLGLFSIGTNSKCLVP